MFPRLFINRGGIVYDGRSRTGKVLHWIFLSVPLFAVERARVGPDMVNWYRASFSWRKA